MLLEQSRYQLLMLEKQQMLSGITNNHTSAPFRCKKILKQALEGAQSAADRFKRSNSSNLSNQRSNVSLLGGEWIGSHALLAVCYRRLEDFSKNQEQNNAEKTRSVLGNGRNQDKGSESFRGDHASTISSSASRSGTTTKGASLFSRRTPSKGTANSSGMSVSSTGEVSNATVATINPRPRSQRVVDKILHRLEKQHRASDEDDDNLTYYTLNSNYTSNTLSSMVVAPIWNQDVLGGRAGALQAIYWLRKEFGDPSLAQDLVVSLAVKILVEGLSTAASMGLNCHNHGDDCSELKFEDDSDSCYSYRETDILFWLCDTAGSHKAYMGASRGVVGILHTLLGLSNKDWKLVEEQAPNARGCVRNTINVFLSEAASASDGSLEEESTTSSSTDDEGMSLHERFVYKSIENGNTTKASGNLRPRLDASQESDTTVDWFHGATGLAMLLLEASKVFRSKEYLKEAHRLCDGVIFPRGLPEQKIKSSIGGKGPSRHMEASNKKGPVGLAGMATCFLQLSRLCSDEKPAKAERIQEESESSTNHTTLGPENPSPKTLSLKNVWQTRAALYAQHAHKEWINYMKGVPTATGSGNAYSLYEGMGGLISLLWQLSLSTTPSLDNDILDDERLDKEIGVQMPLYSLGFVDYSDDTNSEENTWEPIVLNHGDVTVSETPMEILRPVSPQKMRRGSQATIRSAPSQQALAEARRRRTAAEAEALRRAAQAEEAKRMKEEQTKAERAIRNAQRKAELEARKKAQLLARKKAIEVARQKELDESKVKAQKEAEDKTKREALLLARKQARERVEARRKEKEEEDLAKARLEALRKAEEAEKKRKIAEDEKKKRKALSEARLRREKKDAELTRQREEEKKRNEEADRLRRVQELKLKEKQRAERLEQLRVRQQKAAQIAKEKEKKRRVQEEADRQRLEKETKIKEEQRKKQDAERKRRFQLIKERRRQEEERLAQEKGKKLEEKKLAARKALEAKEKRRLQIREERLKKKKDLEEERLRKELQRALDKEVEKQRRDEKERLQSAEDLKIQEAIDAINKHECPIPTNAAPSELKALYSPTFAERKKSLNPAHFSVATRSSLFWSLQTDSNIGSSENYKPALIAADSTPSSAAMSTTLEE